MTVLPLHTTVPPTDLTGQTNGLIEPRLLVPVGKFGQLHHTVARGWFALCAAAKDAEDWNLTWTPGGTYRPYNDQVSTFVSRYMPVTVAVYNATPSTDQRRRIWLAGASDFGYPSIYWIKKNIGTPVKPRYPATAAVPGTSPHGMGCAIDTALDFDESDGVTQEDAESNAPALPWLIANAHRYGFLWSLQSEPWHIQWVMGNTIPPAVLDYETGGPPPPPSGRTIHEMYGISYKLDRWPGPHLDRVGLDSIEHAQDGNSWEIDMSEPGAMPVKVLDRDAYMSMLKDRGRRHVSAAPDGTNTQDPFGPDYEGGAFADLELSALWRAQQRT